MPRLDGTGPQGNGPGTGWGRGNCGAGQGRGRGLGQGRGMGRGFGRSFGQGIGQNQDPNQSFSPTQPQTKEEEVGWLKEEADNMKTELREIEKRLKQLQGKK